MGHDVGIANFVLYGREIILKSKPDVIVIPEVRCEHTIDFVEAVGQMGIRIVVRKTEPCFGQKDYEKATESQRNIVLGRWPYYVDLEICWCPDSVPVLKNWPNFLGDNVRWGGAFTFDHYFPLPKRKKQDKKTVLFASAWDYAERDPEFSIPEVPLGDPVHVIAHDRCREGRDKWIAEIKRLLKKYPDWQIILKTHPAEQPEEYEDAFDDKVTVIVNDFAFRILPFADVLIHAGSTMAAEAHLMGIPAYRFGSYEKDHLILDISPEVDKIELDKFDIGKSNANTEVIKELEETYFGPIDGQACVRAAKYIDRLMPNEKDIPRTWPDSKRDYTTFGVEKELKLGMRHRDILQCCCCKRLVFVSPVIKLAKCPHCSLMLGRVSFTKDGKMKELV
jgi:hypothetical protein